MISEHTAHDIDRRRWLMGAIGGVARLGLPSMAVLTGCASGRVDFTQGWMGRELSAAPHRFMRAGQPTRTMFLEPAMPAEARHVSAQLARQIDATMAKVIQKSGGIRVRADALTGLAQALNAVLRGGLAAEQGGGVADRAIVIQVLSLGDKPHFERFPPNAVFARRPPPAVVAGVPGHQYLMLQTAVFALPSLTKLDEFVSEGSADRKESRSLAPLHALESALIQVQLRIRDRLAPFGEVQEARFNAKGAALFRVSIGSRHGADTGESATFYRLRQGPPPGQNPAPADRTWIASGRITQSIDVQQCWIHVPEPAEAAAVRAGDLVQPGYGWDVLAGHGAVIQSARSTARTGDAQAVLSFSGSAISS